MITRALPVLLLALGLAGCTSSTITNLTPQQTFRNPSGSYSVEAALGSHQQTLRWDTLKPTVIIGSKAFPMVPTPLMTNRWETLIPVPAGQKAVNYRFKFDYNYDAFGGAGSDSLLSPIYRLQIMEN